MSGVFKGRGAMDILLRRLALMLSLLLADAS